MTRKIQFRTFEHVAGIANSATLCHASDKFPSFTFALLKLTICGNLNSTILTAGNTRDTLP